MGAGHVILKGAPHRRLMVLRLPGSVCSYCGAEELSTYYTMELYDLLGYIHFRHCMPLCKDICGQQVDLLRSGFNFLKACSSVCNASGSGT